MRSREPCESRSLLQRLRCRLFGPAWVERDRQPARELDEVTERCRRCQCERIQPKW